VQGLQDQLNNIRTAIQFLQARRAAQQDQGRLNASFAPGQAVRAIVADLRQGSRSDDVSALQQFLISESSGPAAQSLADVGVTAYFGSLTRAALAEFQANVGISPALGNFGAITRAYLSSH